MHETKSPLGVFTMLSTAHTLNKERVKQASARGQLPVIDQEKTASAAAGTQSNTSNDVAEMRKIAGAVGIAGELLMKSASAPASSQPASSVGPTDNETKDESTGTHYSPTESSRYRTGKGGMEDGNHIGTNEDKTEIYSGGSSGLDKKASESLKFYLKTAANAMYADAGSSGRGSAQPASSIGPRDDEDRKIPFTLKGSIHNGSNEQIARTTAQELEAHAKSRDFPLTEPQSHAVNAQSGYGSGPTVGSNPEPTKTAALKNFLTKAAAAHCESDEEDKEDDKKENKKDKKENTKESMGMGAMGAMGAGGVGSPMGM